MKSFSWGKLSDNLSFFKDFDGFPGTYSDLKTRI